MKLPYRIVLKDDALFWFAGLWADDVSSQAGGSAEARYVICTREPNADVAGIHNRMPLILPRDQIDRWLAPDTSREWVPEGLPEGSLRTYRVGDAVGKPGFETPDCIKPLEGALEQGTLF